MVVIIKTRAELKMDVQAQHNNNNIMIIIGIIDMMLLLFI